MPLFVFLGTEEIEPARLAEQIERARQQVRPTGLSRISGTFVIARSTAFTYKGKPVDVKQVGSALTLCGAVPNRVRFGIRLNDIDREMTNLCRCARSVPISIEMNADLPSLDQLRSNAAECIRLAEAARTSQHKSLFIEMADRWLTLAEHVRDGFETTINRSGSPSSAV